MSSDARDTPWHLRIDRVVVTGVTGAMPDAAELRALIETHVARAATEATLPAGRTLRAAVRVEAPTLVGPAAVARAVAGSVAQALAGDRPRA